MSDALEPNCFNYPTFNAFFTRSLKLDSRPITNDIRAVVSPVDGKIWQIGKVNTDLIDPQINAKGKSFTLEALLADAKDAPQFRDANFAVLYLAPSNYHRIHMPIAGKLHSMRYVPGQLFSVNPNIARYLPNVFAKNERVVSIFDTCLGQAAIIFVGAIFVGSIETTWAGLVVPNDQKNISNWHYDGQNITFARGTEIGKFKMGSTVILLFPKGTIKWDEGLVSGASIKMGQTLGVLL